MKYIDIGFLAQIAGISRRGQTFCALLWFDIQTRELQLCASWPTNHDANAQKLNRNFKMGTQISLIDMILFPIVGINNKDFIFK